MGQPELAEDERYANHQARGRNQAEIDAIVGEWTQTQEAADIRWWIFWPRPACRPA